MKYVYISLDAINAFASIRQYQSIDYELGESLYNVLLGNVSQFEDKTILLKRLESGIVFHTAQMDKNRGLLFDLMTFDAFQKQDAKSVITIFQKILKYAVKYFNNLTYAPCEKDVNATTTIVYPFPFTATKNVYKILVDRNSSKLDRKGKNILTVYYSGDNTHVTVSFTSLNKAIEEMKATSFNLEQSSSTSPVESFHITNLDELDLSIDAKVGFNNWKTYLTNKQKAFIYKDVNGAERLEGAAGTGKTLSMILRCIYLLQKNEDKRYVFVTHSRATKEYIIQIFKKNFPEVDNLLCSNDEERNRPLLVTTLQEWCIHFLGVYLAETEYLDKDAQESKELQRYYIEEAYDKVIAKEWSTYKTICSSKFVEYMQNTDKNLLLEMLQYEIATLIKGRCDGDIDKYRIFDRPSYSIPCQNENDRVYLYLIYKQYQASLEIINQFDSDDIILTALGQLNTPIWKRRRSQEGFNACFIDETHLFNLNELSVFHYLNKDDSKNNIVFALDKSQHIGERGILDETMYSILNVKEGNKISQNYDVVFRSSPEIVNLAYNVLSSGVSVFDHFENPLVDSTSVLSKSEIEKCVSPRYELLSSDQEMIERAFDEVDKYSKKHKISKATSLIVVTSSDLLDEVQKYAKLEHKSHVVINSRGDAIKVQSAFCQNKYIIGGIDYIGGLEFQNVIIVGVDEGRVPPKYSGESFHFTNYAWYNRMYVAITRAKYALLLLGNKVLGHSPILESAIQLEVIDLQMS